MRKTVDILGVNIDNVTVAEALEKAKVLLCEKGVSKIYTPNPEIIMAARADESFCKILNQADLCTPDGIGVVYGAKILKTPVQERVAGFDLACGLLAHIARSGEGVFLFGAKPGVAERAAAKLKECYPGLRVSGTHDGYFKAEEEAKIVDQINDSGAKLLLVCLGAPKQEKWIAAHQNELNVNLCMGVGGALDVFAGEVKRAPKLFIRLNLEWLYRLLKQPSRIGRFMALPKFIIIVWKNRKKSR